MYLCMPVCVCVCVLYACKQNPSTYWSKISKCHPEIRPSPQKMASMADLENWWRAAQMSSLFFFFFSECVCVCVRACVRVLRVACADRTSSHLLTSCEQEEDFGDRQKYFPPLITCAAMTLTVILDKRETGKAPTYVSSVTVGGGGGAETWCLT